MTEYKISVLLKSNCLLGSGEGWGSIIDTDIVFDDYGLPYFPARRLKGCLKESTQEVLEMMEAAGISNFENVAIEDIYGRYGDGKGSNIVFNNLYIPEYKDVVTWCSWALYKYKNILSPEVIINSFTSIRQQTAIDDKGIAEDGSLRTVRVLNPGLQFEGTIMIREETQAVVDLLALGCANLRYVGTMRNKGTAESSVVSKKENEDLAKKYIKQLKKEVNPSEVP